MTNYNDIGKVAWQDLPNGWTDHRREFDSDQKWWCWTRNFPMTDGKRYAILHYGVKYRHDTNTFVKFIQAGEPYYV